MGTVEQPGTSDAARKTTERPLEDMTFREAMTELDGIVSTLEGNTLELEQSLEGYERGVELLRSLKARLDAAQQQIDVLMGELSGEQDDEARDSTLS